MNRMFFSVGPTEPAFSVGGEFGSAVAFLAEQDETKRGFLVSWHYSSQSMTAVLATSLATGLNLMLKPEQIESWGWRIPFVFGLLIAPVGLYVRSQLRETERFLETPKSQTPVFDVVNDDRSEIALAVGIIAVSAVTIYLLLFIPTLAIRATRTAIICSVSRQPAGGHSSGHRDTDRRVLVRPL